ncbi:MAG: hypothetical protein ACREO9_10270, partial [Lysobacterales bacterium]
PAKPVVKGCTTDAAVQDDRYFLVTLAARGEADCAEDGTNCQAEALVSEKIGSAGPGGGEGGEGVPLVSRTSVPLLGTVEVVPNPNGGGIGVPISTWMNDNPACPTEAGPIKKTSGSFETCERHEWYGVAEFPADYKCPDKGDCRCEKKEDKLLSYADSKEDLLGIDVVIDKKFPCDIFQYTFGVSKDNYTQVKDLVPADHQLSSCDNLNESSFGVYWISGEECDIGSKATVGSVNSPVFLISAAGETKIHGDMFGILFVTDAEPWGGKKSKGFTGNGGGTIYGAAVMDAEMKDFNGNFSVVYLENVVNGALDKGLFGGVQGGWTDFHADWK